MDITPSSIPLTWFARKVSASLKLWIKITGSWDGDPAGTAEFVILATQEDNITKRWPWKTHDDQMAKGPDGKLAGYGAADGKYSFDLRKIRPDITKGSCTFHVWLALKATQPTDDEMKKGSSIQPAAITDSIKEYLLVPQTADKKPLATQDGTATGKPQVFYGVPFNFNWKASPLVDLKSLVLKGHPDGDQKLFDAIAKGADQSGDLAVTLKDAAEADLTFTIAATKTDGSDDPTSVSVVVHAVKPTWKTVFPMRTGTSVAMNAPPKCTYKTPATASTVDAGVLAALVKSISDARAAIPKRAFGPDTGKGNVYFRDGWSSRKLPSDTSADAAASRANSPMPTGVTSADDHDWKLFNMMAQLEGLLTSVTSYAIDQTITFGAGFSSGGGMAQRIYDSIFRAADGNDAIKYLRPSALLAGMTIDAAVGAAAPVFTVADISDPANPCQVAGNDAMNFIGCDIPTLSFLTNIGIGAQPDLTTQGTWDPSGAAANAQRQLVIDTHFQLAQSTSLKNLPASIPLDAQLIVGHARHAGHFPSDWMGDGATTQKEAGGKVWEKLKSQQGDTSPGTSGDATHGPMTVINVGISICGGTSVPQAWAGFAEHLDAETDNYNSKTRKKIDDSKPVTWK